MSGGVLEIEVKQLKDALADVGGVVEARNTVPILSNVLVAVSDSAVRIEGTDLDMWVSRQVGLITGGRFTFTTNAGVLKRICDKLPADATVTLQLADGKLTLTAGRSRFQLPTLPNDEFPQMPNGDWDAEFAMPAIVLGGALARVAHAISTEETRYYLNGIYVHRQDAELCFAATDGHRLARMRVAAPDGTQALGGSILPRKVVRVVMALLDHHSGSVDVRISKTRVRFEIGDTVVDAKLIDGDFPDYTRVIPARDEPRATVQRTALIEAIGRVVVVSSDKRRAVKLAWGPDLVTLSVRSPEHGDAVEELACGYAGPAVEVGFNSKLVLDALGQMSADEIEVAFADAAAPTLWRESAESPATFVVMPMRV